MARLRLIDCEKLNFYEHFCVDSVIEIIEEAMLGIHKLMEAAEYREKANEAASIAYNLQTVCLYIKRFEVKNKHNVGEEYDEVDNEGA